MASLEERWRKESINATLADDSLDKNRSKTSSKTAVSGDQQPRVWKGLPAKRYGAIVLRPPWQEHSEGLTDTRCLLPADVAAVDVPRLARADALVAVVTTARWLAPTAKIISENWNARVITTLVRVRRYKYGVAPVWTGRAA
jgi:hypothetical protein